jgi:uracil-DNA glycosylase
MHDNKLDSWHALLGNNYISESISNINCNITELAHKYNPTLPPENMRLRSLELCSPEQIKVVILGQDPYFSPAQANGLAFSVPDGTKIPPSLRNIYKEVAAEFGSAPSSGDLAPWAEQGVLLLNSALSVAESMPGSHAKTGWHDFTDSIIEKVSATYDNVVFIFWGAHAIAKTRLIHEDSHLILTAPHPSPLSAYRGFFGCKHFSQANEFLIKNSKTPIIWS